MSKTDCLYKIPLKLETPLEIKGKLTYEISVPCGNCVRCIDRRKMEWGFRMRQEMDISKTAYFVTLTYAPENIPINKYGHKTLRRCRDKTEEKDLSLQGFFKRLRQNHKRSKETIEWLTNGLERHDKIRFYATGEYGDLRSRPHFHAIIFNTSRVAIEKSWTFGTVHCVRANEATIGYVMKYLDKRVGQEKDWYKEPEFNTMSEGIGLNYIERNKNWHKSNLDILFVTTMKGIRIPMPRYYRLKMFTEEERKEQCILVEGRLEELKAEQIAVLGEEMYANQQRMYKSVGELKFKKKMKKRIID